MIRRLTGPALLFALLGTVAGCGAPEGVAVVAPAPPGEEGAGADAAPKSKTRTRAQGVSPDQTQLLD